MRFHTSGLIDAALYESNVLEEAVRHDHHVAVVMMRRMEKSITYCWKEIRGLRSASTQYLGFAVLVQSLAGRTMITFSREDENVTFVGASEGITVGSQGLSVEGLESLHQFAETLSSFAEVCTKEVFLDDAGLTIA